MKKLAILIILLMGIKGYSQNSDLLRLWYLTKVTIDNTDYIPSDYGYYPDLFIEIKNDKYNLTLADPNHITISDDIKEFFTEPDSFTLYQGWFEMPTAMCYDGPDGPCTTIYGKHSEIYYDIVLPFNYIIEQNGDEFSLEIVNSEGNHAYYSSMPLSQPEFSPLQVTLYPNPVSDVLYINSMDIINKVSVYDIQGKVIKTVSGLNSNTSEINLSSLQNGVYFVTILSENGDKLSKKIVKK